jgi:UDP-galactopyranose mutase
MSLTKITKPEYDYLIVGAGLYGAAFARTVTDAGFKCLVVEKTHHIGGNCYTENWDGINVHLYGPHIFHTNDDDIWKWVQQFATFNQYKHSPKVLSNGKLYSFPINLLTIHQIWPEVTTPQQAEAKLLEVRCDIANPQNLEEFALAQVGKELYELFIKGYTEKQWGCDPKKLPASILKRIPIRINANDNYFFDKYQGIPIGGYTPMIRKMLKDIEVRTKVDYLNVNQRHGLDYIAKKIVYTGDLQELAETPYCPWFGELPYRHLLFEHERLEDTDFQGCSIVNYADNTVPHTRITEHKHFEDPSIKHTVITTETPHHIAGVKAYPINTAENMAIHKKYWDFLTENKYILGGRLAEYRYYDMHQVIASALKTAKREIYK